MPALPGARGGNSGMDEKGEDERDKAEGETMPGKTCVRRVEASMDRHSVFSRDLLLVHLCSARR